MFDIPPDNYVESYPCLCGGYITMDDDGIYAQSVAALDELRKDILLAELPYSESWAGRVSEVIQRLNAGVPTLHT